MIPVLIVPTLRREDLLAEMLRSLDHPVGTLVVVDNGRRWPRHAPLALPETPAAADRVVVELPGNLGVAGAWNLGVKSTPYADWWLVVNDDVVWPPGALARAAAAAAADRLVTFGPAPSEWCAFALGWEVVRSVGLFDEGYHPAYYEDTDYCRRADLKGVRRGHEDLGLAHTPSRTLVSGEHRNELSHRANAARFADRDRLGAHPGDWSIVRRRMLGWDRPD